jgi:hypothetical protein
MITFRNFWDAHIWSKETEYSERLDCGAWWRTAPGCQRPRIPISHEKLTVIKAAIEHALCAGYFNRGYRQAVMVNYLVASPDPRIYTISVEIMELVPLLDVLAYSSPQKTWNRLTGNIGCVIALDGEKSTWLWRLWNRWRSMLWTRHRSPTGKKSRWVSPLNMISATHRYVRQIQEIRCFVSVQSSQSYPGCGLSITHVLTTKTKKGTNTVSGCKSHRSWVLASSDPWLYKLCERTALQELKEICSPYPTTTIMHWTLLWETKLTSNLKTYHKASDNFVTFSADCPQLMRSWN